jgi:hypothetical protein
MVDESKIIAFSEEKKTGLNLLRCLSARSVVSGKEEKLSILRRISVASRTFTFAFMIGFCTKYKNFELDWKL